MRVPRLLSIVLATLALTGCNQILGIQDLTQLDAAPGRPCTSSAECTVDLPRCDLTASTCDVCMAESDCAGYAGEPHCGKAGACVACRDSNDCTATANACDETSHQCRACAKDDECPSKVCDAERGSCVDDGLVLYVSSTGSGITCTHDAPCKTLGAAHALVDKDRKIISVAPGTYETTELAYKACSVRAAGAALVGDLTLTGGDVTVSGLGLRSGYILIRGGAIVALSDMTIQGTGSVGAPPTIEIEDGRVTIRRVSIDHPASSGIRALASSNVTVEDSTITNGPGIGIFLVSTGEMTIQRNRIVAMYGSAIYMGAKGSFWILNNLLARSGSGVFVTGDAKFVQVEHNTIVANGSGVVCEGSTTNPVYTNNIIYGSSQMHVTGGCAHTYSVIGPITPPSGEGNLNEDPQFVNAAAGDFSLTETSSARDRATPIHVRTPPGRTVTDDILEHARPFGDRADVGAYEYVR